MAQSIFGLIETRSFSNVWFWVVLAFAWSAASYWTLGVPYDLVRRAARRHGRAQADLDALARVSVPRRCAPSGPLAPIETALVSGALTAAALLGFRYGVELAQAVLLLAGPLVAIAALDRRAAARIVRDGVAGEALALRLRRIRRRTQAIGGASIFVTAFWGSLWTLATAPVGF